MVFIKYKIDPARIQGKIAVKLTTTTPQLSLSDDNATLDLKLSLRIASSTQEGRPLTLCVDKTVFQVSDPEEGGMDMFSRGAFGIIRNADPSRRGISLGYFKVHEARRGESSDLRELGYRFITVPGDGSWVEVTHKLSWERIFRYEEKRAKTDLEPGEKFEISINRDYLGTMWWCWGDLEGELQGKKFHIWQPGPLPGPKPSDEFVKEGNWVLGEELRLLDLKDVTEGRKASFEIVE
ncbi:hypothetical protein GGS26DRAFT_107048 [Hypomontagnella submonticulosa]|nr:hypothetical protein GGS26DRAFT_107048 [Hypomontagnella submonticulosa]